MFGNHRQTFKSKFNSGDRLTVSAKNRTYIDKKRAQRQGVHPSQGAVHQGGSGLVSSAVSRVKSNPLTRRAKQGKELFQLLGDAGHIATKFVTAPQKYAGEKHMIQKNKEGKFVRGAYIGPGTNLMKRLVDGDKPVSFMDGVSAVHDIDYTLAKNAKEVRQADLRMLNKGDEAKRKKLDFPINIAQGKIGIKSKVLIENNLGVPTTFFTDFGSAGKTPSQMKQIAEARAVLTQQGYGTVEDQMACEKKEHDRKNKPARGLYRKLCKQTRAQKKKDRKRQKYHKVVKKRMNNVRRVQREFNDRGVPKNVMEAIKSMKF